MNQPGMAANPTRGQLNREARGFSRPRSRLRILSRETSWAVLFRANLLILYHNQGEKGTDVWIHI